MKLLKNKEIKINLAIFGIITLIVSIAAFLWNKKFGIFVLCVCGIFIFTYYIIMRDRYKKIAKLSQNINSVLHGDNTITFDEYDEGELCILKSELYKMTVCL